MDGRQPFDRGDDLDTGLAVLIAQNPQIGSGGQRKNRVFHRGHIVFWHRIEQVADEEIPLGLALWQHGCLHDSSALPMAPLCAVA